MKGRIIVSKKSGILDPEGDTINAALHRIGFEQVSSVRVSKVFEIEIDASSESAAKSKLMSMADKLLKNPVMEDATVELLP